MIPVTKANLINCLNSDEAVKKINEPQISQMNTDQNFEKRQRFINHPYSDLRVSVRSVAESDYFHNF